MTNDPELRRLVAAFNAATGPHEQALLAEKAVDRALALDGMSRTERRDLIARAKAHARAERQLSDTAVRSLIDSFRS